MAKMMGRCLLKIGLIVSVMMSAMAPTESEAKKYDKCVVIPINSNGKKFIAVQARFGYYDVTDYIPITMPFHFDSLVPGEYFCIRNLSLGIGEFIDSDGNVWDFGLGATWKKLQR